MYADRDQSSSLLYGVLLVSKKKRMLLRGLDEVGQLLHEVGHLLYGVGQLLCEVGQRIFADSHQGMWQAGHKSRPSVGKGMSSLKTSGLKL